MDFSRLKRSLYPITEDIRTALEQRNLMEVFKQRPAYQQNDYIGWIQRSKRPETRAKRLNQMLEELEKGGIYMGMRHSKSEKQLPP